MMAASIPASAIVNVLPNVISAGGSGLDLVGLLLTQNTQAPIGSVLRFSSAADVAAYFGALSTEATLAATYFAGYDNSAVKPATLWISQYAASAVSAYLRGGSVASLTLAQLQALTGVLTINVNGTNKTSSTINLSAATSFSNAAALIQAAFTSPGFTVSYDPISGGFVFTTSTTGATATMSFATGTLSAALNLTQVNGAVLSQGSAAMTPAGAMASVIGVTQDFVSFTTAWEPSDADKTAFAVWVNGQNNRFAYIAWTAEVAAITQGDTTTIGPITNAANYSGTIPIYDPNNGALLSAFLMGAIASLDTAAANGRATMAFRTASTLLPGVTNQSVGDTLIANGYNFLGGYATAAQPFVFFYPGQISGPFNWTDSWVSQVWLNNNLQLALMNLLTSVGQVPYNTEGYSMIEAALAGPVADAVNFGAIRAGVALSTQQKAEINNAAGGNAADTVQSRGWYVKVTDPGATVRAARGSPVIHLWYADGQSVQKITLNSVLVQ
jgi:hypothetical protein